MDIGVPRERRDFERRVGLTPIACHHLVSEGHRVFVETRAGAGSGYTDRDYQEMGGEIVFSALEAFGRGEMVLKVTPPLPEEFPLLRDGHLLLGFLHLAVASPRLVEVLMERKVTAVAYETIQRPDGSLPVLLSMSMIAGRMAPQIAARYLESSFGGHGILLSGLPGVPGAEVCILGAGVVGSNAARAFLGLGARVTVLDADATRLEAIEERLGSGVTTMIANERNLRKAVSYADVLLGAVLIPGARSPVVVTREMVRSMRPKAVILDYSIDQGGCVETSRPTSPGDPVFVEEDVVHYCVPNIPGIVARTSSRALSLVAMPFIRKMASHGPRQAVTEDQALRAGVNVFEGRLVNPRVAASFGMEAQDLGAILHSRSNG